MFSSVRNFVNRHRRKFVVTGLVIGGAVFLTRYAQRKLRDWQERETRRFLDLTRKKQHFESTERTCNQTVLSLSPVVCDAILRLLDTEHIVAQLRNNPENKLELWEQLKVMTFTRASVFVYACSMLVLTLRTQLNLIGGYLYKDSSCSVPEHVTGDLQHRYLSLCHYFISDGLEKLNGEIEAKVKRIIEPISLKQNMNIQDVEQIFWAIQAALCTDAADPLKQIPSYFINEVEEQDPMLRKMLSETMDLLESDEAISICMSSVSRNFSTIIDSVSEFFNPMPQGNNHCEPGTSNGIVAKKSHLNSFISVNKIELPLAKLIPVVNGLMSQVPGRGMATSTLDTVVQQLILNDKLKTFGANIYEAFSS